MGKNGLIRKWDLMYEQFGRAEGKCKDCSHFVSYKHHGKTYRKCKVYGVTCSEASDWRANADACGLFNKETEHENVIRMITHERDDVQIEGQMSFGDYDNDFFTS